MDIHRFGTEVEGPCDLFGALAITDVLENLKLPVRQTLDWRVGTTWPSADGGIDQSGRYLGAHERSTGQDQSHHLHEFLQTGRLHQIAPGSTAQRALGVKGLVVHGQHQNGQRRNQRVDVLEEFNAVVAWNRHVRDHHIGMSALNG